ncbi:MAG TPA: Imm63 family immunity protein [Puia sp.]|jgi:hypothetical protein
MKSNLNSIKEMIDAYAEKINATKNLLPTYGNWKEYHPDVDIDENGQLYYQIYERGQQLRNDFAYDEDDLCFRVFAGITYTMATEYALKNKVANQDFRRTWFAKQEELLGELNEKWKERQHKEHEAILRFHPFNDSYHV